MSGVRVSFCVIYNAKVRESFTDTYKRMNISSPNVLGQVAAEAVYDRGSRISNLEWLQNIKSQILKNYSILKQCLGTFDQLKIFELEAGYLVLVDYSGIGVTQKQMENCLLESKIIITQLQGYYVNPPVPCLQFRINIALPEDQLLGALLKFVSNLSDITPNKSSKL